MIPIHPNAAFVALLCILSVSALSAQKGSNSTSSRYAVIFDAGSSGTRVNIFTWNVSDTFEEEEGERACDNHRNRDRETYVVKAMESLAQIGHLKTNPGISDFHKRVSPNAAASASFSSSSSSSSSSRDQPLPTLRKQRRPLRLLRSAMHIFWRSPRQFFLKLRSGRKRGVASRHDEQPVPGNEDEATAAAVSTGQMPQWQRMLEVEVEAYLKPLVTFAASKIHSLRHLDDKDSLKLGCSPSVVGPLFYATAGMRLVSTHQEQAIMGAVRNALAKSEFGCCPPRQERCLGDEWIRVISGAQEAEFDWLTVNAALGLGLKPKLSAPRFTNKTSSSGGSGRESERESESGRGCAQERGKEVGVEEGVVQDRRAPSVGALDLGGWSTQVAYVSDGGRRPRKRALRPGDAQDSNTEDSNTEDGHAMKTAAEEGAKKGEEGATGEGEELVGASHLGFGALGAFEAILNSCALPQALRLIELSPHHTKEGGEAEDGIILIEPSPSSPSWMSDSVPCPCLHPDQIWNHTVFVTLDVDPPMHQWEERNGVGFEDSSRNGGSPSSSWEYEGWALPDLAVFSEWAWEDWVGASDFDGSRTIEGRPRSRTKHHEEGNGGHEDEEGSADAHGGGDDGTTSTTSTTTTTSNSTTSGTTSSTSSTGTTTELEHVLLRRERQAPLRTLLTLSAPSASSPAKSNDEKVATEGETAAAAAAPPSSPSPTSPPAPASRHRVDPSLEGGDVTRLANAILEACDVDGSGDIDFLEFQAVKRLGRPLAKHYDPQHRQAPDLKPTQFQKQQQQQQQQQQPQRQQRLKQKQEYRVLVRLHGSGDLEGCRALTDALVGGGRRGRGRCKEKARRKDGVSGGARAATGDATAAAAAAADTNAVPRPPPTSAENDFPHRHVDKDDNGDNDNVDDNSCDNHGERVNRGGDEESVARSGEALRTWRRAPPAKGLPFFAIDFYATVGNLMIAKLIENRMGPSPPASAVEEVVRESSGHHNDDGDDGDGDGKGGGDEDGASATKTTMAVVAVVMPRSAVVVHANGTVPSGPWSVPTPNERKTAAGSRDGAAAETAAANEAEGGAAAAAAAGGGSGVDGDWSAWSPRFIDLGTRRRLKRSQPHDQEVEGRRRGDADDDDEDGGDEDDENRYLRVLTVGHGAAREAASRANEAVDTVDDDEDSGGGGAERFAAPSAAQLSEGGALLCAEPYLQLAQRLDGRESSLKVARACFGSAYVLSLLSAYGLLDQGNMQFQSSPAEGPPQEEGEVDEKGKEGVGDEEMEKEAKHALPRDVPRVVFAESFKGFEGSWALGALVHRLLADPPR